MMQEYDKKLMEQYIAEMMRYSSRSRPLVTEATTPAEPEAIPTQAEPEAIPTQAEPEAIPTQAEPEAIPTQAEPEAIPTQTEPEPAAEPEVFPVQTEPAPMPEQPPEQPAAEPEPVPEQSVPEPEQPVPEPEATPTVPEATTQAPYPDANSTSVSYFRAQVLTGNKAIPIRDAAVLLRVGRNIEAFLLTDENGQTPLIETPAPPRENTLEPYNPNKTTDYSADIAAEGFTGMRELLVSQVGESTSLLTVDLTPLPEGGGEL